MAGEEKGRHPLSGEEFAARLRGARAFADMTLAEMGELVGVSPQGLSKRENLRQPMPDAERYWFAKLICERTGLPEAWFTETERSRLSPIQPVEDDLEPADVVDLVERDRDDDGGSVAH